MSAKIEIPATLKDDLPQSRWGKVLASTPIVMTVIATALAGLSSSEMTRAQYDRSMAAQLQSKAGDQWSYFQAKRLRAALQRNTLDVLRGTTGARALDAAALTARLAGTPVHALLATPAGTSALDCLTHATLPSAGGDAARNEGVNGALAAVEAGKADADVDALLAKVKPAELATALADATERVRSFDATLKRINAVIDVVEKELAQHPADDLARDFTQARLTYAGQRYDAESRQNQVVAQLLELQVRKSNLSAERHHARSQRFFYGMLAAQLAVIISTFSIAARKRNFLWALAASAGAAAVGFAAYVYLYV
ncbi:MAG TPA: DUF4337 family protein [Opitutaceae bacterium]|nr:DUF4337 family protein [Opitutaceae bacterium]HND60424.1 DUF4337 family protein [Opitutaceae bacterium]